MKLFFSICIICICLAGCTYENTANNAVSSVVPSQTPDNTASSVEAISTPDNTIKSTPESLESSSQRNAVRTAKSYLNAMSFSKKGLIHQLVFDKYSDADAKYAVDQIDVDWNEQAAKTAETYLNAMAFSKQDLIHQLEFDGYTNAQAVYGVDKSYK